MQASILFMRQRLGTDLESLLVEDLLDFSLRVLLRRTE